MVGDRPIPTLTTWESGRLARQAELLAHGADFSDAAGAEQHMIDVAGATQR